MNSWHLAMIYALPLLALSGVGAVDVRGWLDRAEPKLRAWAVMLLASMITYAAAPVQGHVPFQVYSVAGLLAALIVLSRPRRFGNWAIGLIFAAMAGLDAFALAFRSDGTGFFYAVQLYLGWLQWFILIAWGTHDAARGIVLHFRHRRTGSNLPEAQRTARPGAEP